MTTQPADVRLSVIVPAYNEAATVAAAVERLRTVPVQMEIIAIDDGSTDGTRLILQQLHARGAIAQLMLQEGNEGKGTAVRMGIQRATGDIIVIQDADLEYDPREFPQLMAPILDGRADAVFGSRFLGGPHRVLLEGWGGRRLAHSRCQPAPSATAGFRRAAAFSHRAH